MRYFYGPGQDQDPFTASAIVNGQELPLLRCILSIFPGREYRRISDCDEISSHFDDTLIQWNLQHIVEHEVLPRGTHVLADPGVVHLFANKEVPEDRCEEYYLGLSSSKELLLQASTPQDCLFFAPDLPGNSTELWFIYNPTGNHWVFVRFVVTENRGKMLCYDSTGAVASPDLRARCRSHFADALIPRLSASASLHEQPRHIYRHGDVTSLSLSGLAM